MTFFPQDDANSNCRYVVLYMDLPPRMPVAEVEGFFGLDSRFPIHVKSWWWRASDCTLGRGGIHWIHPKHSSVCFCRPKKATALTTISTMNAMTLTLNNFVHGIIKSDASLPSGIWMARLVVGFESYESGWIKVLSRLGQQKMRKNIIKKSAAKNGPLCFVLLFIFWSFTSFIERFEHLKKGGKHEAGFSGLLYQLILENEIRRYSIRPMQSSKSCSGGGVFLVAS